MKDTLERNERSKISELLYIERNRIKQIEEARIEISKISSERLKKMNELIERDKIINTYICECGGKIKMGKWKFNNKSAHNRSKIHLEFIKINKDDKIYTSEELNDKKMTLTILKTICKNKRIKKYSKLNKSGLIDIILKEQ